MPIASALKKVYTSGQDFVPIPMASFRSHESLFSFLDVSVLFLFLTVVFIWFIIIIIIINIIIIIMHCTLRHQMLFG